MSEQLSAGTNTSGKASEPSFWTNSRRPRTRFEQLLSPFESSAATPETLATPVPYQLIYRVTDDVVVFLACFHGRRSPRRLVGRT